MALTPIANLDPGLQCRNTLNSVITLVGNNHPWTSGSIPFTNASADFAQNNAKFFWDNTAFNLALKAGSTLSLGGSTSGTVTLATQAAAGSWTFKFPTSAGTNLFVLQTDGAGNTSWVAQSGGGGGGMAIGGAITSATAGSVLFAGVGGVLAQDNTNFFWDDTGNILKLAAELDFQGAASTIKINGTNKLDYNVTTAGKWTAASDFALDSSSHKYFIGSAAAIFVIPNVSGNNWFEGAAGNAIVSGYGNFGTGDAALAAVTSGFQNVALGAQALASVTSGTQNLALGSGALNYTVSDSNNIAIGTAAGSVIGLSGAGSGGNVNNIIVGFGALGGCQIADSNVVLGASSLSNITGTASGNTVVGAGAGTGLGSGGANVSNNTLLGKNAARSINGSSNNNIWIGGYQGTAAVYLNTLCFSDGSGNVTLEYSLATSNIWSMNFYSGYAPAGLHLYNTQDTIASPTNYERAVFDWNIASNILVIGTRAGGTGVKRLTAIDGFAKAGAPAAGDLPSGSFAVIDDTSGGQTWVVFNKAGTIRKVQLV